jgi:tRNA (guanine-N7-)-methyltransferase
MDWSQHYPAFAESKDNSTAPSTKICKQVSVADIGCGFGGLLFALSPKLPDSLIIGLEIRTSVTQFVQDKVKALRKQHERTDTGDDIGSSQSPSAAPFQNVSCLRANTMKFLPNLFLKAQLSSIFLCFPDPHFKARKHKQRIVSTSLASEYAFVMQPGGKIYTITDVEDLHLWMVEHFTTHPSFERVPDDDVESDVCVAVMRTETEEGKKVERNGGTKFVAVFRRLQDPDWI